MQTIFSRAAKIKLLILDVDGVLTDGKLYYTPQGEELKVFHVQDGIGIKLLQKTGVQVAIITSRESPIVSLRMKNLGVEHIYQGQENKKKAYETLLTKLSLDDEAVAYMGDDLPDLALIKRVGLGITVPNADKLIKQHADWLTAALGGQGAVREICELIMRAQNTWQTAIAEFS